MPQMSGFQFVQVVKERFGSTIPIIMLSGYGNVKEAVDAMKIGAYSYFLKPVNQDEICLTIEKALEFTDLRKENQLLREELSEIKGNVLTSSNLTMQQIFAEAKKLAQSDVNVLITGESGTGKEVIARFIHDNSKRRGNPFVAINCQAYVETLIESELFGYKAGSFTGAQSKGKIGRLEVVKGGTLFLDEIGELALPIQVKLLRVLENKEIEPIGSLSPTPVNFRLLSATNRDLQQGIEDGRFREDLYYRLNTVTLALPPLRERREDVIPLARHFLQVFAVEQKKSVTKFTVAAEQELMNYRWQGNIRELRNVIEGAIALSNGNRLDICDLRIGGSGHYLRECYDLTFAAARQRFEKNFLENTYRMCKGNISLLSRTILMDRKQLYRKLAEFKILDSEEIIISEISPQNNCEI